MGGGRGVYKEVKKRGGVLGGGNSGMVLQEKLVCYEKVGKE